MKDNPYAAPKADPQLKAHLPHVPQGDLASPYGGYRKVGTWRYLILTFLGAGVLLSGLQIKTLISLNHSNVELDDDINYEESVNQLAETSGQIGQIQGTLIFLTVVMWCFWKNKSCKNAWLFQSATLASRMTRMLPSHQNITPGWAVGYYFVPIMNLWKPYQAMVFIRDQVSAKTSLGPLVGLWWTLWLVTNGASNYFYRNDGEASYTTAEALSFNRGLIIDETITIIASILAAAVIQKLTTGQERMASEYGLSPD